MANACISLLTLAEASFSSLSQGDSRITGRTTVIYGSLYLALIMSLTATVISAYDAVRFQSASIDEDDPRRAFYVHASVVLRAVPAMFTIATGAMLNGITFLVAETQPAHVRIMITVICYSSPALWLFSLARWCFHYFV
jgi:hypothetical protein